MPESNLKQKIAENLERLPEGELQEVLDFVDFLVWRNSKQKETISPAKTSNLESSAIDDSIVHYVEGVLVVKSAPTEAEAEVNWESLVQEMREERIGKVLSKKCEKKELGNLYRDESFV